MSKKNKIIKLVSVTYSKEYKLNLVFADGVSQLVDFKPFLESSRHQEVKKYLDLKKFKKFNFESNELMWGDFDLIFPIIDLYENNIMHENKPRKQETCFLEFKARKVSTPFSARDDGDY
jgi:hypothetical protein